MSVVTVAEGSAESVNSVVGTATAEAVAAAAVSWPISAWRHPDPRVADLPGVVLDGVEQATSAPDTAAELYRRGARRVALPDVVDLTGEEPATPLAQLAFVRDLTAQGVVVDWRIRIDATPGAWSALTHLYPPTDLHGAAEGAEALDHWRRYFHLCRCVYRVGPGFVQVRDRRSGELSRLTIDEPEYIEAVERLLPGASEQAVAAEILDDLAAESLVWRAGGLAVWLPYRAQRWPWPSMAT